MKVERELSASEMARATIRIQAYFRGFKARQALRKQKEREAIILSQAEIDERNELFGSVAKPTKKKVQSLKEERELSTPEIARATIRIQAYFRGFKARQALRKQKELQNQSATTLSQAAWLVQLKQEKHIKHPFRSLPKTPAHSIDLSNEDIELAQRKELFASVAKFQPRMTVSPAGQRIKQNVPQQVDEYDMKKKPKKVMNLPPTSVAENKSGEFDHHPADVVIAAITIQRFFKKIKEKKAAKKVKKSVSEQSSDTEDSNTSSYDSSEEDSKGEGEEDKEEEADSSDSDSSEQDSQRRPPDSSDDSSATESEHSDSDDSDDENNSIKKHPALGSQSRSNTLDESAQNKKKYWVNI